MSFNLIVCLFLLVASKQALCWAFLNNDEALTAFLQDCNSETSSRSKWCALPESCNASSFRRRPSCGFAVSYRSTVHESRRNPAMNGTIEEERVEVIVKRPQVDKNVQIVAALLPNSQIEPSRVAVWSFQFKRDRSEVTAWQGCLNEKLDVVLYPIPVSTVLHSLDVLVFASLNLSPGPPPSFYESKCSFKSQEASAASWASPTDKIYAVKKDSVKRRDRKSNEVDSNIFKQTVQAASNFETCHLSKDKKHCRITKFQTGCNNQSFAQDHGCSFRVRIDQTMPVDPFMFAPFLIKIQQSSVEPYSFIGVSLSNDQILGADLGIVCLTNSHGVQSLHIGCFPSAKSGSFIFQKLKTLSEKSCQGTVSLSRAEKGSLVGNCELPKHFRWDARKAGHVIYGSKGWAENLDGVLLCRSTEEIRHNWIGNRDDLPPCGKPPLMKTVNRTRIEYLKLCTSLKNGFPLFSSGLSLILTLSLFLNMIF